MMHAMDWDDLRYVLALGRTGTLSEAALELGVVRTTVGRRVRALETALGVRLFDPTPEGFVATVAGRELMELAERMEAEILVTRGRLLGRDAELRGSLRVSMLGLVYEGFLDVFASFGQRYPGIEVTIVATDRQLSLLRREADVVIRLNREPPPQLWGKRLKTLDFAPYASRGLVERVGAEAPLSAYPWIHGDERSDTAWLDAWLSEHAPGVKVAFRTDDYVVVRTSILAGVGVHFLPCFYGDAHPELVCVGPKLEGEERPLWLLTLADLRNNRRVRAFMDHVSEGFARL